jgi:hypothetical protein
MAFSRPTLACTEVLSKTAQLMLAAMEVAETEQTIEDMVEALKTSGETFEGLKSLDYNCWLIRDKDIKVFLARDQYRNRALIESVRVWVTKHNILPQFAVGDEVRVKCDQEEFSAVISEILADEGIYRVYLVARCDYGARMGTVPFEAVHDLAQPPEAFQLIAG